MRAVPLLLLLLPALAHPDDGTLAAQCQARDAARIELAQAAEQMDAINAAHGSFSVETERAVLHRAAKARAALRRATHACTQLARTQQ